MDGYNKVNHKALQQQLVATHKSNDFWSRTLQSPGHLNSQKNKEYTAEKYIKNFHNRLLAKLFLKSIYI